MKKSCFCLSLIAAFGFYAGAETVSITKQDFPQYMSFEGIASSDDVQDSVRSLMKSALSVFREALQNKEAKGDISDIEKLLTSVNYLVSLKTNLNQADNISKLPRLIGINQNAQKELTSVLERLLQIHQTEDLDSLLSVLSQQVPPSLMTKDPLDNHQFTLLNEKLAQEITRLKELDKQVKETKTWGDVMNVWKDYPELQSMFVGINQHEEQLQTVMSISSIEDLQKSDLVSYQLKEEVQNIQNAVANVKTISSINDLLAIGLLNEDVTSKLKDLISEKDALSAEKQSLSDKLSDAQKLNENIEEVHKRNIRFLTLILAVIARMQTGFDYRSKTLDSEKEKDSNKSLSVATSKSGLSYLGGKAETLHEIANELNKIYQTLVVEYEWINNVDAMLKSAQAIKEKLKSFNDDAAFLKTNADYLVDVLTSAKNPKISRPPRDNVANFSASVAAKA